MMNNTCGVILAAGKGNRMNSKRPKALSEVLFRPMLQYVIEACYDAGIPSLCTVAGYEAEQVKAFVQQAYGASISLVLQHEQKGTGHAVMQAKSFLQQRAYDHVCILYGDSPCFTGDILHQAYQQHRQENNAVTVITAQLDDPYGYGRVVRQQGRVLKIVEQRDATPQEQQISEVNAGAYWFSTDHLLWVLDRLTTENDQQEYYLTQTVDLLLAAGERVGAYRSPDSDIMLGVNSRQQQWEVNEKLRKKMIKNHCKNGVEFVSADGVVIGPDIKIGADTVILPGSILKNNVTIGSGCVIGPNTLIENSQIGDRVRLNATQCYDSNIHSDVDIGPFVHIRPGSEIKSFVHIGDFVEVKNASIGEGTGISHLTYVGDSDVGQNVNFGCGVVTVNYDGQSKMRCTIEDDAFIGCNTNLIAPVRVGKGAYTAAGSTVDQDVPDHALAIARARQQIKPDYAQKLLQGKKKKYNPPSE